MTNTKAGFVAIAGRPNAGKSTLLNRVLKTELSIVSPKAQTTRERVLGILTEESVQIVFIDTPGIHRAREGGINDYMMREAEASLDGASCVWYLVDPSSKCEAEVLVLDLLERAKVPVYVLFNKTDWQKNGILESELKEEIEKRKIPVRDFLHISAKKGDSVEALLAATRSLLPESPFYYPDPEQLSDKPTRFFVAEKIREQLLMQLGDEIPYSCAVEIEKFDENSTPKRIEAVIHVERESQKGMVIGKGGIKIKAIGIQARRHVEEFLGETVFLGLKVNLLKDWSKRAEVLHRLGYELPRKTGRKRS